MRHELKTDPIVFQAVLDGLKTYELRKNDRAFAVGDTLLLRETRYTGKEMISHEHPDRPGKIVEGKPLEYTGREVEKTISHILTGPVYGLANEWSILSFNQSDELEAARAEIENVQFVSQLHYDANLSLRQQLAAEQAKNVGMREALISLLSWIDDWAETNDTDFPRIEAECDKALSTQSDTSALEAIVKKVDELVRERGIAACDAYCEHIEQIRDDEYQAELAGRQMGAIRCASAIRALPAVTLDDLKGGA